jgi:hypothetical protein
MLGTAAYMAYTRRSMWQPKTAAPVSLFYSYAHADEPLRQQLEAHLSLLRKQGLISDWCDREIRAGSEWAHEIDKHLETVSIILLLISSDFLASDYCYGIEMRRAMQRHDANEARVIPILLRPVDWDTAPFAELSVLPTNARPITTWRNRDKAWADVVRGIRRAIEGLPPLTESTPRAVLPSVWNIPFPRNPVFTGREELLERLARQLRAGHAMAITQLQAISGLGGVGKTMLAVEYAYRYHQDYQAVLWAHAESREGLISAFVAIARWLKLPEKDAQELMMVVTAVKAWLQKHTGWLLILDNADDLTIIPDFLPSTVRGHVLLTTRAGHGSIGATCRRGHAVFRRRCTVLATPCGIACTRCTA